MCVGGMEARECAILRGAFYGGNVVYMWGLGGILCGFEFKWGISVMNVSG